MAAAARGLSLHVCERVDRGEVALAAHGGFIRARIAAGPRKLVRQPADPGARPRALILRVELPEAEVVDVDDGEHGANRDHEIGHNGMYSVFPRFILFLINGYLINGHSLTSCRKVLVWIIPMRTFRIFYI